MAASRTRPTSRSSRSAARRTRGNNYTLDGVPITDMRNRASAHPSIESLEDMKVQVHTYDAEMGRTGGGVFNSTLRSGRKHIQGVGLLPDPPNLGDSGTTTRGNGRAGRSRKARTVLVGGAVSRPMRQEPLHVCWFATEDYHDVQTRNVSTLLPTAAMRRGDFTGVTNSVGQPVVIYNPLNGQPFANNQVPASMMSPFTLAMLQYLPTARCQMRQRKRRSQLHADLAPSEQLLAALFREARAQVQR